MSITSVGSTSGTDQLVNQIISETDTNHDGQVSSAEFGAFLTRLIEGASKNTSATGSGLASSLTGAAAGTATADASGDFRGQMLGFDLSRMESAAGTPKYAFANLAQGLAPTETNMQLIAAQLGAGVGHLDSQNNFMLDADAGGYIGVRDRGNGPMWQWMAYNTEHVGPNGETT